MSSAWNTSGDIPWTGAPIDAQQDIDVPDLKNTAVGWMLFGSAAAFGGMIGCAEEGGGAGTVRSFVERDSAGVTILVTPGRNAFAPLAWDVESVPDLVLGSENSPGGSFHQIRGVKALPAGNFLVLDGGNHELRLFDGRGQLLATAGRPGRGPGEFAGPVLVPSVSDDSVLIFDQYNLRFQIFSADLQGNRTQRVENWGLGRRAPHGAVGVRTVRERRLFNGGSLESTMYTEGPIEETREFYWYHPVTGVKKDLDSFSAVRMYVDRYGLGPLIPFAPDPVGSVGADFAVITDGRTYEIRQFDPEGRLRRILRIDADPDPVTPKILEAKIRAEIANLSESSQRRDRVRYAQQPVPEMQPAFRSLIVDDVGWLWAQVYQWDSQEPRRWVLFDPEGRAHGTVQTPSSLDVHIITREHVFGVSRDGFDVQHIHRHRLRRAGS
jgi:hypothetical protein